MQLSRDGSSGSLDGDAAAAAGDDKSARSQSTGLSASDGPRKLTPEERRQQILFHHAELIKRNRSGSVALTPEQSAAAAAAAAASGKPPSQAHSPPLMSPHRLSASLSGSPSPTGQAQGGGGAGDGDDHHGLHFSDDEEELPSGGSNQYGLQQSALNFDSDDDDEPRGNSTRSAKSPAGFDFDSSDGSDTEGSGFTMPSAYQSNIPVFDEDDTFLSVSRGAGTSSSSRAMSSEDVYAVAEDEIADFTPVDVASRANERAAKDRAAREAKETEQKRSLNSFSTLTQACRESCPPLPTLPGIADGANSSSFLTGADWNERYQQIRQEITQFNANTSVRSFVPSFLRAVLLILLGILLTIPHCVNVRTNTYRAKRLRPPTFRSLPWRRTFCSLPSPTARSSSRKCILMTTRRRSSLQTLVLARLPLPLGMRLVIGSSGAHSTRSCL